MPPGPKMVEDKCPPGPKRVPNIQNNGTEDKCPQALPLQTLRNTPGHTLEPVTYPPLPPTPSAQRLPEAPRPEIIKIHRYSFIKMSDFKGWAESVNLGAQGSQRRPGRKSSKLNDIPL